MGRGFVCTVARLTSWQSLFRVKINILKIKKKKETQILPKRSKHESWMVDMAFGCHHSMCGRAGHTLSVSLFCPPYISAPVNINSVKTTFVCRVPTGNVRCGPVCVLLHYIFSQSSCLGARVPWVTPILLPMVSTILLRSKSQVPYVVAPARR